MVKGRARNCKRTRRTRQQILMEAEATILNKIPSSIIVENTSSGSATQSELIASSSIDNGDANGTGSNLKKSLRIIFQDAISGKLAGRHRRSRLKRYYWPRTVEAARSPSCDSTGKNKMFFALAIDLYPESKIIQPSDTESEDEEISEQNYAETAFIHTSSEPVIRNTDENHVSFGANANTLQPCAIDDTDECCSHDKSLSPVSPKKKRGRKPSNTRRIPYGRATDIDHSWRSNYNRRCIQRRTRRQVRNRIKDPQVILDVINSVVERYSQGISIVKSTLESDDNNNRNTTSNSNTSLNELHKRILPPPLRRTDNLISDIAYSEPSASDVSDVEIDVVDEDDENDLMSQKNKAPANIGYAVGDGESEDYYEDVDDDDEDDEIVVL